LELKLTREAQLNKIFENKQTTTDWSVKRGQNKASQNEACSPFGTNNTGSTLTDMARRASR